MVPNFQSSFIPKEPVTQEPFKKQKTGMLGMLMISLLVASAVLSIGMYVYKIMLRGDIENLQAELAQAESGIDKETISEMSEFGKKLDLAKGLVAKHRAMSNFLSALSSSTVSSVRFTEMNYGSTKQGALSVELKGKADSYATVALQESVFEDNQSFQSISFSDLTLSDKGGVAFDADLVVDPKLSVYSP